MNSRTVEYQILELESSGFHSFEDIDKDRKNDVELIAVGT